MRVETAFEAKVESVAHARGFVVESLAGAGLPTLSETAALLAGELAANAVVHARTAYRLMLDVQTDRIVVAVGDRCTRLPVRVHPSEMDVGGRGLLLLDALAERWGVREESGGKWVWFSLRAPARRRRPQRA